MLPQSARIEFLYEQCLATSRRVLAASDSDAWLEYDLQVLFSLVFSTNPITAMGSVVHLQILFGLEGCDFRFKDIDRNDLCSQSKLIFLKFHWNHLLALE